MTTKLQRRDLLKLGAAGLAASALTGCATTAASKAPPESSGAAPAAADAPAAPVPATAENRRVLGRTGLTVPIVSMGVMNADNPNLVRAALDGGMGLLDTAHGYQNGRNEEMLGTVLPARKRDSFLLCTKVFLDTQDRKTGLFSKEMRPEEIAEKLEISLKRLGLDHVDVLYLHNQSVRESALNESILKAMEGLKKAGKTRFLGVTTHKNEPAVIRAAIEAKVYDVVLTSYNFKQEHHLEVQKAIGEAAAAGLGIVAMKTQAGVFWDKEKKQPIDPKAALRWAIRDPNVHTAIPGFTTLDQLQIDLAVLREPAFTDTDHKALVQPVAAVGNRSGLGDSVTGFFCQGCEGCKGPCPKDLPIPELMRSYMYAHAYKNREAAQSLLLELGLPGASPCSDCTTCAVKCRKGFDVRERIADIVRLQDVPREFLI
ncbi:MAG TPA: aldo/keto reductase [Myxococcales bacterium]